MQRYIAAGNAEGIFHQQRKVRNVPMKEKLSLKLILSNFDAIVTSVTLMICVLLVNLNIIMRYFFSMPIRWSEEVVTSLFVWTVFIGSAYAYRKHQHLGVDILINHLPRRVRRVVDGVMAIIELLVLVMLTVISAQYVYHLIFSRSGAIKIVMTDLLRVPKWWTGIAVPIGFGLSAYHSVRFLFARLRGQECTKGGEDA